MKSLETIRILLQDRRVTAVADATGLSRPTIISIKDDPKANPSHDPVKRLSDYFEDQERAAAEAGK
jgi:hypothetical protein